MKSLASMILGSTLIIPLLVGCPEHRQVVVYGTYGPAETPYYSRWEAETHRDHREFERRKKAEQREYWEWRKHYQQ